MRRSWVSSCMVILSCALGVTLPALAISFDFVTIDPPGAARATFASGINDVGQIVGSFVDARFKLHGYLRISEGTFITIDAPGAAETDASGINSAGQIVGSLVDASHKRHGYLRTSEGIFTTIDAPGAAETVASGINRAGQIGGTFRDADGKRHGYLRTSEGIFTTIDAPGAAETETRGINNAGQIVGAFWDAGGKQFHGYLRTFEGTFSTIDAPGARLTRAFGINDAGQIVGAFWDAGDKVHGYLRTSEGIFTTIDAPGAAETDARGINIAGQTVGAIGDTSVRPPNHGYVATPTQLPQQSRVQESTLRPILYFDIDMSAKELVTSAVSPDGRQVGPSIRATAAAWSPDGKAFAYVANAAGGAEVLKLRSLDGDEKTLFTPASGERLLGYLMWSPDGLRLALITLQPQQGRPFGNSLVILDVASGKLLARHGISDRTIHLPYFFSPPNKFRWSPDGRKILLSWENVAVIDAETGRTETISSDPAIAEWAPDSSGIFYFAIKDPHRPPTRALGGLYLKKLGSGNPTTLLDEKRIQGLDLTLSPLIFGRMVLSLSGKRLAVAIGSTKSDVGVLLMFDTTAGQTSAFERPLKIFQPKGFIIALDWAPDERSIAALAVSHQVEVETVDVDSGEWKTLALVAEGSSNIDLDTLGFAWLSWTM